MTSYKIHRLTYGCLQYYLEKFSGIRPSCLVDPHFTYVGSDTRLRPWRARPAGRRYQPQSAGPPSWMETQRVARAIWRIQAFYDLKNAAGVSKVPWFREELQTLPEMSMPEFYAPLYHEVEQLKTVLEYIQSDVTYITGSEISPTFLRLPQPKGQIKITDMPSELSTVDPTVKARDHLQFISIGENYGRGLLTKLGSPIRYISFTSFRRLGFAIWDQNRMETAGLWRLKDRDMLDLHGDVPFRWRSLLTEEEIESVENENETRRDTVRTPRR